MIDYQIQVIAKTRLPNGAEFVSWSWRLPQRLDGEWRTHRQISKSASSFRAIPVKRMIKDILDRPFVPDHFSRNEPGMQGHTRLEGDELAEAQCVWSAARFDALKSAQALLDMNLHKQDVNRLLTPWAFQQWINTARIGHLDHLWALRDHPMAEPHFCDAIQSLRMEIDDAPMVSRRAHLPYINDDERNTFGYGALAYVSAVRCRRVSLFNLDNNALPTFGEDLKRGFDMARENPVHATPFEHQVTTHEAKGGRMLQGNFVDYDEKGRAIADGVAQFRKTIEGEYTKGTEAEDMTDAPDLPQFKVRCPTCEAIVGRRCTRPKNGNHVTNTHAARMKLAREVAPLLTDTKESE